MSNINDSQDEIIEEFGAFDNWLDKYQYLIDLGTSLAPLEASEKTPENLIDGCQSRLWLDAKLAPNGTVQYRADSDAIIVKGIVSLLIRVLAGHTPQEIIEADLYFIDEIGLRDHLSPTRSNGLLAMLKKMKAYAVAFGAKA